ISLRICGETLPPIQIDSHTEMRCTLPEGEGTTNDVTMTVDGQSSNSVNFSYDPPSITSISPSSGPIAGGIYITVYGENFGQSQSVRVNNNNCPTISAPTV